MRKETDRNTTRELDKLRKENARLEKALAASRETHDIYGMETRITDGETFTVTRSYYRLRKDAVNDAVVAMSRFLGDTGKKPAEPKQVAKGNLDFAVSREDGQVFRATITRIKLI